MERLSTNSSPVIGSETKLGVSLLHQPKHLFLQFFEVNLLLIYALFSVHGPKTGMSMTFHLPQRVGVDGTPYSSYLRNKTTHKYTRKRKQYIFKQYIIICF